MIVTKVFYFFEKISIAFIETFLPLRYGKKQVLRSLERQAGRCFQQLGFL